MVFGDDPEEIHCPACSLSTASAAALEEELREKTGAARRLPGSSLTFGKRKGPLFHPVYLIAFVLLAVASFGLSRFLDNGLEPVNLSNPEFARFKNPAIEMALLTSKVYQYRTANEGRLPKSIGDLFPEFIDREPTVVRSSVYYDYRTDPRDGFILSCPNPTKYRFRSLSIHGDGVMQVQ